MTEQHYKIARDYHTTDLSLGEISRKYGIGYSTASRIGIRIGRAQFLEQKPPKPKAYSILKINPDKVDYLIELMERRGIDFEVPERCELVEIFESKINTEDV